jgi:hypothetical protein
MERALALSLAGQDRVMGTAEVRRRIPTILDGFRRDNPDGSDARPVFIGRYEQVEAALVPIDVVERIVSILEDLLIYQHVAERVMEPGQPMSLEELDIMFGFDAKHVDDEVGRLAAELGLG